MLIEGLNKLCGGTWNLRKHCRNSRAPVLTQILRWLYTKGLQAKGSWISLEARFASIPCFPHGIHGIFISGGATIGRNCVIFQQVTIGSNTLIDSPHLGAPTIGDDCYIGAGAKIIGKVTLGRNVRVGANAVVVRDVPDNSVVTGGEQRVVTRDHVPNNRFYHIYKGRWRYYDAEGWRPVTDEQELALLNARPSVGGPI
jgi:serine O-acetyltransferase